MPKSRGGTGTCERCGQPLPPQLTLTSLTAPASPKARRSDPSSSHDAAKAAWPRAGTQRAQIVAALANAGHALSAEEIARRANLKYVSASTRCTELVRYGWCRVAGERDGKHVLALTDAARLKLTTHPAAVAA